MVLATFRDYRSEQELSRVLASRDFGTPASNIRHLISLGYTVDYRSFSWEELQAVLQLAYSPIVFVDASFLPWADFTGFHAILLIGATNDEVILLDPASDTGPVSLAVDGFLAAWEEFDRKAAVIGRGN
jgi:hypothetical protein